ncbi:hypothetical protein BGZ99_007213 [Dissophora globulifera]|uniref:Selenoprotein H n=1 Tax=Dissophora globulifera TaxID=979702 RepID=A0A9P6RSQ2_9FUNG|nr:hypothetical protein BGZ99_007213 [Dissophora globulifera]
MAKTPAPADAGVVKRKPGRPPGTTKKSPSTAELKAAAVAAAAASGEPPRGRGRPKSINASSTSTTTTTKITAAEAAEAAAAAAEKRKLDADGEEGAPRKRGRPAGTGKKQKAAAAAAAAVVKNSTAGRVDHSMASDEDDDAADAFHGIKLTIERCTTCTQYHKNVVRIFDLARKLHPNALFQEDVVPNSKSFEIYVSSNGSKNKLIWSGKAHAPPKRLAFPDSDVFVNLLEEELKDK